MRWRVVLLTLVVAALAAKALGADAVAVYALLAAIPPAAVVALLAYADLLDRSSPGFLARIHVVVASLALVLVVAGAAAVSPA